MTNREIEVDGEKLYLKKDFLGWRIVNPIKNPDGGYNWINFLFGGWRNLITLILLLGFIAWNIYETKNAYATCSNYFNNIIKNCICSIKSINIAP